VFLEVINDTAYVCTTRLEERGSVLYCVDLRRREITQTLTTRQYIRAAGVLPDGRILDASLRVVDLDAGQIADRPLLTLEPPGEHVQLAEVQVHGWHVYTLYDVGLPWRPEGRFAIADARAPEQLETVKLGGGTRHFAVRGSKAFASTLQSRATEVFLVDLVERTSSRLLKSPTLRGGYFRDPQMLIDARTGHIFACGNEAIYELDASGACLARTPLSGDSGPLTLLLLKVRDGYAICATGNHVIRLELAKADAAAP
jgi:hypothetical protein